MEKLKKKKTYIPCAFKDTILSLYLITIAIRNHICDYEQSNVIYRYKKSALN